MSDSGKVETDASTEEKGEKTDEKANDSEDDPLSSSSLLSDFPTASSSSTEPPTTSSDDFASVSSSLLTDPAILALPNAPAWLNRLDSDSGGAPRSKKEVMEEAREKMQVLISS